MKTLLPCFLFALTSAFAASDCCRPAATVASAPAKPACCATLATQPFTKTSLYQADATFTDDRGHAVTLGELRGRPVVLTMFFASCSYACPLTVTDMQSIRAQLPEAIRERAVFLLISFDTERDTVEALQAYRAQRQLDAQWVLLRGNADAVREIAALLGVKYQREATGNFAHSNLITVLNAEGEVVHQRTGLQGGLPETAAAVARTVAH